MLPLRTLSLLSLLVLALVSIWVFSMQVNAAPQQPGWDDVQQAIDQGLPKTAVEKLQSIRQRALEADDYDEAIKAIAMQVALEGNIEGNKPEAKIKRMQAEIEQAPAEMKPVMEAILANWYWHYLQQNRWRFRQRTETADAPSDDFTTWDLERILAEIDSQFKKALGEAEFLKQVPVEQYSTLLEQGSAPDKYRPTLYDVVAFNALEFYQSAEQVAAAAQDAFVLSADSPIFADLEGFLAWQPESSDEESLTLTAIELYQDMLRFHQNDEDLSARLDVNLHRLQFGYHQATGEEKTARYKAALRRFERAHAEHALSSRALYLLAFVEKTETHFVKAREIALEGKRRHPESIGARACANLIAQIEAPRSSISTERVWNDPRPAIDITYRNLTDLYLRLVPFDFEASMQAGRWSPQQLDRSQREALFKREAIQSWHVELPATDDYKERTESFPVPDEIPHGSYYLITSHNEAFDKDDNQITFTEVWESDLALVTRNHHGDALVDGFVMQATSGQPIANASVEMWQFDGRTKFDKAETISTDQRGYFKIEGASHRNMLLRARHQDQMLTTANQLNLYRHDPEQKHELTQFFTDRSLYRPGQTIHYKGIVLRFDHSTDTYTTISNRDVTVWLLDANNQKVEQLKHTSNEYGSFSGSLTAPRDRLTGQMSLWVEGTPSGATRFQVEEYKRPKFEVELASPEGTPKLGDEVSLSGSAKAYTGAAIDSADVRYRVVREVRYPPWWYWGAPWRSPGSQQSQEITHGVTSTDADGRFEIEFTAEPAPSAEPDSSAYFQYSVYADVTDRTGETRSAQSTVSLGFATLTATLSAPDFLTDEDPVAIEVAVKTLNGQGQAATGSIHVHKLKQPDKVARRPLVQSYPNRMSEDDEVSYDPAEPTTWPLAEQVAEVDFETDASGTTKADVELAAGIYRAVLKTTDRLGKEVRAELMLRVLDPDAEDLSIPVAHLFAIEKPTLEPGETLKAIWGSGYDKARAFIEIEHRGKIIKSFWSDPSKTQQTLTHEIEESMRGGINVFVTMVRENRAYLESHHVNVPWTNKQLKIRWERFVSKLEPAAKEKWTAVVSGPDAEKHAAEMVATLYDASLDAYLPHSWSDSFGVFRQNHVRMHSQFQNQFQRLQPIVSNWEVPRVDDSLTYPHFPSMITQNLFRYQYFNRALPAMNGAGDEMAMAEGAMRAPEETAAPMALAADAAKAAPGPTSGTSAELDKVSARKELGETAFFFPHLTSEDDGTVRMEFTMPEALTEWKFLGFAHDQQLRSGLLTGTAVTAKELMVQPNPPRFLREGDEIELTVKVTNQSPTRQNGTVRLTFSEARTGDSVDVQLGNQDRDQAFEIPAGQSQTLSWRVTVAEGLGLLTYKAVGSTGRLSDGEEGYLPVLSRRVLLTESLPLPIRDQQTRQFTFDKLLKSAESKTIEHQSLTVQMVSNPSWYAVMALPYLMEYPYECSEQVFNRLYANSLGRHIALSDPKIKQVFEQWRGTDALDSPMEKNEELKDVMLQETPWVLQAKSESQARRNVGILFETNRMQRELDRATAKLRQAQLPNGAWPWFPGGRGNDYITLYITTGFGRLQHLGIEIDPMMATRAVGRLDQWMTEVYSQIPKDKRRGKHISPLIAFYLYGRTFFLDDRPVADAHRQAFDFWVQQAKTYWLEVPHRQSQAHLAIALHRLGERQAATSIMNSIRERSITDEELGMYWRDLELSWWWYRAPIETQAMMIEAFDEVVDDREAVEQCKVWLLKQKQTQDWKTTKATADAVYGLLLRGSDLLTRDQLVEVYLAGTKIEPDKVEAGTGFYQQRIAGPEVEGELGKVTVKKLDEGVAWGSLHWQYLEDISEVTPHEGTPLKLTKQLYVRKYTKDGPVLNRVEGPLNVGDELVVRLVLRTDRDMEYVHLKDHRGSGTEPVDVLSHYRYQDGLAYYQSTKDTATHFFIDYLPKGTYVFEYSTWVQLRGEYQTGFANIQCMYAPEFNSHSESLPLEVEAKEKVKPKE